MWGIQILNDGVETLGMGDFTYSKIFEAVIPAPGNDTSVYPVTVPGYNDTDCVVVFTPINYLTGAQSGGFSPGAPGYVPVYRSLGGEVLGVVRRVESTYYDPGGAGTWRTFYTTSSASLMEVYRVFGG